MKTQEISVKNHALMFHFKYVLTKMDTRSSSLNSETASHLERRCLPTQAYCKDKFVILWMLKCYIIETI